ncbi:hypothetical protein RJT34_00508 [Clitoria ternatea]|uniref:C3H1-type domain-containing protein n=1 Tax=Clitoria ternatea TaxID=43366 RepID=A0AAN9PZB5_CLITE
MEDVQLGTSKHSQFPVSFPPYTRSHLRSQTCSSLIHILSHLSSYNGICGTGQENQEKELECFEFNSSDSMDPKNFVPRNEMPEVHKTIEGVEDKGRDFIANEMIIDDIEFIMGMEETSTQANDFDKEQRLMDELKLVVKGSEDFVGASGLTHVNSGLDAKQQGNGSEGELADYQVDSVDFLSSDVNMCGNASQLQIPEEPNQLGSEAFDLSSMLNVSTSTEGQASAPAISTCSLKHESQQKEMELQNPVCAVGGSLHTTEEGELEKDGQCGQKVAEATHVCLDMDTNSEVLNMGEEAGLPDSTILKDNKEMQNEGDKLQKLRNSSDAQFVNGDAEEGEIYEDLEMNGYSFDMSNANALTLQPMNVDDVEKPKSSTINMVYTRKTKHGKKDKGFESNFFMVNVPQGANSMEHAEHRTGNEKGIASGIEATISHETSECHKEGEHGSLLKPIDNTVIHKKCKEIDGLTASLTQNQVLHRGFMEENASKDHRNSSVVKQVVDDVRKRKRDVGSEEEEDITQLVDANKKKIRGPVSEARKEKRKMKYRKKRAEKNREQGVKRLKLQPAQKPKTLAVCRHYQKNGRCNEGDKCRFSHDVLPLTKSTPCSHFARHSCMRGDDCPYDHQLSKYPCNNFVSKGSCSRGAACLFSHQVPANQDVPTPSNVCRPELKSPLVSGNRNSSTPLNNHGSSSVQQNRFTSSAGIHPHTSAEHTVTNTVQKQPKVLPKGISFLNVTNLSPSSSTPKQGMVRTTKESPPPIGTHADHSTSGTAQNMTEIPKKLPAETPKGINFLSFGGGTVCSFKSPISSYVNREGSSKLPQLPNFGLSRQPNSYLNKNDYSKVSDATKQDVTMTDLFSNEILDKSRFVEGMNLKFPWKTPVDVSMRDHVNSESVQEGKRAPDNSESPNVILPMLPVCPFVSSQSTEHLLSGEHKDGSNSGQRALKSTLAFAAEHESNIKLK